MLPDYATNLFLLFFWISALACVGFLVWSTRHVKTRRQATCATVLLTLSVIGLLGYLIADHYTGSGINDAALFQVSHGMAGLQPQMWLPLCALLAGALLGVAGAWRFLVKRANARNHQAGAAHSAKTIALGAVLALLAVGLNPGWSQTGSIYAISWLAAKNVENVMEHAQLPAPFVPVANQRPVSAVYIYAEGLEGAFLDNQRFPGLMPNLGRLAKSGVQVRGIKQVSFTGWTAAGQIASNCGFPGLEGKTLLAMDDNRWPCASNLLAKEGYDMVYLNGSSLEFSDKGGFWRARGYGAAYGDREVNRLGGKPGADLSEWGAYDDVLLDASWNEYRRLAKGEKPFVLTLLTVDTHAPLGLQTPSCKNLPRYTLKDAAHEKLLQSVHCADFLLGSFLDRVLPTLPKDTVVILQSDHLQTPRADVFPLLGHADGRDNLFLVWGSGRAPGVITRQASMFDVAPTFLSLLGRKPGGLNLGRDLFAPAPTLIEAHGKPWLEDRMRAAMMDRRMAAASFVEHQRHKEAESRLRGEAARVRPTGDPFIRKPASPQKPSAASGAPASPSSPQTPAPR